MIKTSRSNSKPSVFKSILKVLNSDIVWLSISISLVLCSVLFYFQVLQPKILAKYAEKSIAQINTTTSDYNSKLKKAKETQLAILISDQGFSVLSCNNELTYNSQSDHKIILTNLETKLRPEPNLQKLPAYNIFSYQPVENSYNEFYKQYQIELTKLSKSLNLQDFIDYRLYQNIWIDYCNDLQVTSTPTNTINQICNDNKLQDPTTLSSSQLAPIKNNIAQILSDLQDLCQQAPTSSVTNFDQTTLTSQQWYIQFLNIHSQVISTELETKEFLSSADIESQAKAFQQLADKTKVDILQVVDQKKDIQNIWYLMKVDPRILL